MRDEGADDLLNFDAQFVAANNPAVIDDDNLVHQAMPLGRKHSDGG